MKTPKSLLVQSPFEPAKALYAGSFDPWSDGHQFVLENGLQVFSEVHVILAINPSKSGLLSALERLIVIASANNPFCDWFQQAPPFLVADRLKIDTTEGLVVEYAREHGISHLLRGLRSTTDFESEFNLYFANRAILKNVQTWTLMCPPELLHCSSSYVKTVVGKTGVPFVGTSFLAQALMTRTSVTLGQIFDLIKTIGTKTTPKNHFAEALQLVYSDLFLRVRMKQEPNVPITQVFWQKLASVSTDSNRSYNPNNLDSGFYAWLWSQAISEIVKMECEAGARATKDASQHWRCLQEIIQSCKKLGYSEDILFDRSKVEDLFI